jgi:serralysin
LRSDGTPDLTFGSQGKVITQFSRGEDFVNDIVIDASNRIVAAGYSSPNFAIARYNVDGSLDLTFDGDGKVTTDFFGFFDQGNSVAIQPDGKIVVAGIALPSSSSPNFGLARYNSDGSLDNSFGTNGKLITDFSGQSASANALALQPDSKVVLLTDVASSFALARYLLE